MYPDSVILLSRANLVLCMCFIYRPAFAFPLPVALCCSYPPLVSPLFSSSSLQRRYFVLHSQSLDYFAHPDDPRPKGSFVLTDLTFDVKPISIERKMQLKKKVAKGVSGKGGFLLTTAQDEWEIQCETEAVATNW